MSLNLDANKFHYALRVMAQNGITLEGNAIVCDVEKKGQSLTETEASAVLHYLESNAQYISKKDLPQLERLRDRFNENAGNASLKERVNQEFAKYIDQIQAKKGEKEGPNVKPDPVLIRIRQKPANPEELLYNLRLAHEKHPRFQLDHDLSVIDVQFGCFPEELDPCARYTELLKGLDELDGKAKKANMELIQFFLHEYKPREIVKLMMVIHPEVGGENGSLMNDCRKALQGNIPLVMTKALLHTWPNEFEELLKDKAVFIQDPGGLMLVLPTGGKPKEYGFSSQFAGAKGTARDIPLQQLHYVEDIKRIFLKEPLDRGFHRIAYHSGHGIGPRADSEGSVGVSISEFQQGLNIFEEYGLAFLGIKSCESGGINAADMHIPGTGIEGHEKVPFPILIHSSTSDTVHFSPDSDLFEKVQEQLFQVKSFSNGKTVALATKPLTQKKVINLFEQSENFSNLFAVSNLPTLLFPNVKKQAKKAYSGHPAEFSYGLDRFQDRLVDISSQLQKQKTSEKEKINVIIDQASNSVTTYLFTNPIVPAILKSSQFSLRFISRGGVAHHVMRGVITERICLGNMVNFLDSPPKASKVFAFGSVHCRMSYKDQRPTHLERVVIMDTEEKQGVIFRLAEDPSHYYFLDKNALSASVSKWPDKTGAVELTPHQASLVIYDAFRSSQPSQKTLYQMTGGMQTESDFYNAVDELFWKGAPPSTAKLMRSLVDNRPVFGKLTEDRPMTQSYAFDEALKELDLELPASKEENKAKRKEILGHALVTAIKLKKENLAIKLIENGAGVITRLPSGQLMAVQALRMGSLPVFDRLIEHGLDLNALNEYGMTILFFAVNEEKASFVDRILQEEGLDLNQKNVLFYSAIHYAIIKGNVEIFDLLAQYGADTNLRASEKQYDPLSLAIKEAKKNKLPTVAFLLHYVQDVNLQDRNGNTPLHHAIDEGEWDIAKLLLKHGAKADLTNQAMQTPRDLAAAKGGKFHTLFD